MDGPAWIIDIQPVLAQLPISKVISWISSSASRQARAPRISLAG